jgi:glutamate/tyrosine decarboxylase-like PLP-dependent enzyme
LPVWATLRAYGREGYREMVERHLELAQHLARSVDAADDLERLADVVLNIVCFRYRPVGLDPEKVDEINEALAHAIIDDGRVYVGGTVYGGKRALRPAIVNWRTTERDIDLIVQVVRELGARLTGSKS